MANIKLAAINNPIVKATYQGCIEKGLCYVPQNKTIFSLASTSPSTNNGVASSLVGNHDDKTTTALKSGNLWLLIAGFL